MSYSGRLLTVVSATIVVVACDNPRTQANVAQAMQDAATEINGLHNDLASLQAQLDSMREVMAKQDSNIARIAAVNNIPIR